MMPDDPRDEALALADAAYPQACGRHGDRDGDPPATATLGRGAGTQHADGTPVRVLVVDDEPSLAELLSSVLRYEGWSVQTAGSGAEAVKAGPGVPPGRGRARHHAPRLRRR